MPVPPEQADTPNGARVRPERTHSASSRSSGFATHRPEHLLRRERGGSRVMRVAKQGLRNENKERHRPDQRGFKGNDVEDGRNPTLAGELCTADTFCPQSPGRIPCAMSIPSSRR